MTVEEFLTPKRRRFAYLRYLGLEVAYHCLYRPRMFLSYWLGSVWLGLQ